MRINIDSLTPIKVARHYDGAADVIEFDVGRWIEAYPALTEYRVEVTSPGGAVYFPEAVNLDGNMLKWTIMPSDTGTAGNGEYQIVATGSNGERKTSASARFVVREIMEGTAGETPPDPAQPWVEKVLDAAQKVEDATVHPPVIGENGNWWLWDFDAAAYVDSGKPSQGSSSGGGGIAQETDPTVPAWAKQSNPPTYTAQDVGARPADWLPTPEEIGAQPAGNYALKSEIPAVPVQSVNGKTGAVELTAEDVNAASKESVDRLNEEIVDQGKAIEGKADKPNKPVLIDTITIKELVDKFAIDVEPDGTPYAFKKLVVRASVPPHETIGNWNLFPFAYGASDPGITLSSFPSKSAKQYAQYVCDVSDGFTNMIACKGNYDTVLQTMQATKFAGIGKIISRVDLRANGGIPAGTVIEIEAIRA